MTLTTSEDMIAIDCPAAVEKLEIAGLVLDYNVEIDHNSANSTPDNLNEPGNTRFEISQGDLSAGEKSEDNRVECQLYQVDLSDPNMDPIEWSVRSVIPIPKEYYWNTKNYDLPISIKAWHRTIGILQQTVKVGEKIGGVVADVMGVNSSNCDYVTGTMTEAEWKEAELNLSSRQVLDQIALDPLYSLDGHGDAETGENTGLPRQHATINDLEDI